MDLILQTWRYISQQWQLILLLTMQHIYLVGIAVCLAVLLGVPLGILIVRFKALAAWVLNLTTLLLTLPAIALFGLMIPILSRFGHGLGTAPAISAAFLYALLPIVRNTYTALVHLDHGVREAGCGLGLTFWQRLKWVEIPLTIPAILGGIRTATVLNIGVMAIAAIIGAGGMGTLILQGINQSDMRKLLVGALTIGLLAMVMDSALLQVQRALTPKGVR